MLSRVTKEFFKSDVGIYFITLLGGMIAGVILLYTLTMIQVPYEIGYQPVFLLIAMIPSGLVLSFTWVSMKKVPGLWKRVKTRLLCLAFLVFGYLIGNQISFALAKMTLDPNHFLGFLKLIFYGFQIVPRFTPISSYLIFFFTAYVATFQIKDKLVRLGTIVIILLLLLFSTIPLAFFALADS